MLRSNDFEDFVISKINNSRSVNIKYDSVINIDNHDSQYKNRFHICWTFLIVELKILFI